MLLGGTVAFIVFVGLAVVLGRLLQDYYDGSDDLD